VEHARYSVFVTPGIGVDPTNEYRDEVLPTGKHGGQHTGKQDLSEQNLIKVRQENKDDTSFEWSSRVKVTSNVLVSLRWPLIFIFKASAYPPWH